MSIDQPQARMERDVLHAALRRWIAAMDACQGAITQDMDVGAVTAAVDESQAAHDALVALAREVLPCR